MPINFSPNQWDKIKKDYEAWWNGELDRPLIHDVRRNVVDPSVPKPSTPLLSQQTVTDLSIPAKDLIERWDYELSTYEFVADAFPHLNLDCFGPGVVAAFCGATLDNSAGSVWFHPPADVPIKDLNLEFDPNNKWFLRIKEICQAANEFWQGQVLVGMPDLGGTLDILATFRTSEGLLFDLYDEPEEVKRLTAQIQEMWYRAYDEINEILQPVNPGYGDWGRIYSAKPQYILQSDFAFMISNDMFKEFALPTIKYDTERLDRAVFHLDGMGMLPHLDDLLSLPGMDCIQWCHGAGNRNECCADWPDVHKQVLGAGKKSDIFIADLTGARHNVMVEVGYALRHVELGRMLFYFQECSDYDKPPFDLNGFKYHQISDSNEIRNEPGIKGDLITILNEIKSGIATQRSFRGGV